MNLLRNILWVFALFLPQVATAHSPYIDQRWSCGLDGGFRVTFLYGDGIIGPDPRALIVLDAQGLLWAYENVSYQTVPFEADGCSVLDVETGEVVTPHPPSFAKGARIVGDAPEVREARWAFEPPSHHAWGMMRRDEGRRSTLSLIWVQLRYQPAVALILAGLAAFILFVAGFLSFGVGATWPVWIRLLLGICAVGSAGVLCLFLFAILAFAGAPVALTLSSLVFGGVFGFGAAGAFGLRRRRA